MGNLESDVILIGFLLFIFTSPISSSTIQLGSKISTFERTLWVSSNGHFAFGFFNRSDQPNQYSVGIRFNSHSIPPEQQTLIWVAGADVSVGPGSLLRLTKDGDLTLSDASQGSLAWSTNTSQASVASASLLDNGNLVLLDNGGRIVWQSFATPSDTLVPTQTLSSAQTLRAASRNAVSSYYSLTMADGELKLNWETNITYWKSSASASPSSASAVLTKGGAFQLLDRTARVVWSRSGDDHDDPSVNYRFLRLDVDGNLRMYSWRDSSGSWRSAWQAVGNQCEVFATCGLHGVCAFGANGTAECKCPFASTAEGCLAPYDAKCGSGSAMVAMKHTMLYGLYPPEDAVARASADRCRSSCLRDPACTSITVTGDGNAECRMKRTRFITGYEHPSIASVSYVKVCLDPIAVMPTNASASTPLHSSHKRSRGFRAHCLVGVVSGASVAFVAIQIAIGVYAYRRRRELGSEGSAMNARHGSKGGLLSLAHAEVKALTSDFKNPLGGDAYKGTLVGGEAVMVEDLKGVFEVAEEKEFRCAVAVVSRIHHKNLLRVKGYCCEAEERRVAVSRARGGQGAHERFQEPSRGGRVQGDARGRGGGDGRGLERRVRGGGREGIPMRGGGGVEDPPQEPVAREGLLLRGGGEVFSVRVRIEWVGRCAHRAREAREEAELEAADGDLHRRGEGDGLLARRVSRVRCARGLELGERSLGCGARGEGDTIRDARWGRRGAGSEDDVGRFGWMVVELVCGRRGCRAVYEEWVEGGAERVVDGRIGGRVDYEEAERALRIAFWCAHSERRMRPAMGEVVGVLEGALAVDRPPPPPQILEEGVELGECSGASDMIS
ncbi:G-type lectin S-receptor-like serine/threonine-protein kinase SD3-1 [Acorus calamus]|uniref:Receptor-like serine/threonine-protein kinase n=1 Tax=Acorus calamus TaxID=4465 RepID=A0AAV9C336_ACOCL|nr:G-type lectin S-receptor-like serine/threonine-protein kinase SD3-1 [Acorus calamus]